VEHRRAAKIGAHHHSAEPNSSVQTLEFRNDISAGRNDGEEAVMRITLYVFAALCGLAGASAWAAPMKESGGRPPARILQLFSYEVKDQTQFEEGYRRHLGWHAGHGDTLVWYGWTVDSGARKGAFVDGTAGATYAGLDARPDPTGDSADAVRNFTPFVQSLNVETWELVAAASTALPLEDRRPGPHQDVFILHVRPGDMAAFERALARLVARRAAQLPALTWYRAVRGEAVPAYMLVLTRNGWSDLDRARGSLREMLQQAYSAPDAVDALLGATSEVQAESWSYEPRLSLIPGEPPAP